MFTAQARYRAGSRIWDLSTIAKVCAVKPDLCCIQVGKPNHQHNYLLGPELELRDLLLERCAFLLGNDLVIMLHFSYERRNWSHGQVYPFRTLTASFTQFCSLDCSNGKLFIESLYCLMGCCFCQKISWGFCWLPLKFFSWNFQYLDHGCYK